MNKLLTTIFEGLLQLGGYTILLCMVEWEIVLGIFLIHFGINLTAKREVQKLIDLLEDKAPKF